MMDGMRRDGRALPMAFRERPQYTESGVEFGQYRGNCQTKNDKMAPAAR